VGGESIKVTGAADPDTGVVPVQATTSAHSSGATGVGRSDGFFVAAADGSAKLWTLSMGTLILFPTGPDTLMTSVACGQLVGTPGICQGEQEWDTSEQVVNGADKRLVSWSLPFSTCSIEQTA